MGSAVENSAANVAAPAQGNVRVISLSTTATAATSLTEFMAGNDTASKMKRPRWITFTCSERIYILFGDANVVAPDDTQTSGTARCWEVPADTPFHVRLTRDTTHFRVKAASGTPKLRYYPSDNTGE